MPSTGSSGPWTFSELLGQPRLLGLGALLAWLVLFHLLVNVWLLCVFTSLLVVLGGWLGSRALLDANSLLHLEHFLPAGGVNPPPPSPEHECRLNHELHSAVHKAVRDFVSSWYRALLPEVEGDFERVVRNTMLEAVMELKERARRVDRKLLVQRLLELYGSHLQSYMTARHMRAAHEDGGSLWQLYRGADAPHPAVSSAATELSYSRALVNLVLHVLVPYPHMESRTGGYVVTELITCNLLMPLVSRVSDPDWLNQIIVDVFARSREGVRADELPPPPALYARQVQPESWTTCRSPCASEPPDAGSACGSQSAVACECDSESSGASPASAERMENCHSGLLTPCNVKCCLLASGHCSALTRSKMVSVESVIQSDSEDDIPEGFCDCGPPTNLCNRITSKDDEAFGCFGPLKSLGPRVCVSEDAQWPAGMAQERSPTCPPRRTPLSPCSGGTPGGPAAPVRVHNVHIAGTVTAKDQRGSGTHPCTMYTIKFDAVAEAGDSALCRRRTVHRRYSEFLNLQTRLEENLEAKRLLKNVKGPKKMFPDLPFGNADNERVEARKGQLDTFLKQLSSIPETAHSEDMHEFLALSSDPAAYFERKPVVKSKIDKMMENALDTLKTAFPHPELLSPTEELDAEGDGRAMDSRRYRRLMFPSKVSPSLNIPDLHPKVTYCFSEGSRVLNGMSMSGLESFIKEQERLMCEENGKDVVTRSCERPKTPGKTHGTDTAVADVALNILCLLMKDQWSWLCTENIQKTIRLLFGTFIERWLDIGVAHLTSASCWVIYLQVLQETVWPGGTLPVQPRPERSAAEREETKEQCLKCLMQLLPELVTDMLGSEKYRLSAETVLESLQDCQINKHLIYCVCDLLLELLVPESCDELSQKSLPQSLAKGSERNSSYR